MAESDGEGAVLRGKKVEKRKLSVKKKTRKTNKPGICLVSCYYDSVKRAAKRQGFTEMDEDEEWTVFWNDQSVGIERCLKMKSYQRINHFPGMNEISRKDLLSRNLTRMYKQFGKDYHIFPRTWTFPADQADFLTFLSGRKKEKIFICKPQRGCQGRGIFLSRKPHKDVKTSEGYVVQQYLSHPLLIDGFKFDLRVYVLVTSCDPFRIYVFHEGLARFATTPYKEPTASNIEDSMMHLTNYSINKESENFVVDDSEGHKRRFAAINEWLRDNGHDVEKVWREIDDVIVKTLLSAQNTLQHNYRSCFAHHSEKSACFEILGFDVMLDRRLKPWVIEVNHTPSFHTDSPMDKEIKEQLLQDSFKLIHVKASDRINAQNAQKKKSQDRLSKKERHKPDIDRAERLAKRAYADAAWESKHLGGFRRAYPLSLSPEAEDPYSKFLNTLGSLYQTTAVAKAREELAKQRREELNKEASLLLSNRAKKSLAESKTSEDKLKRRARVRPRSLSRVRSARKRFNYIEECMSYAIKDSDEVERNRSLDRRMRFISELGLQSQVYRTLHCTPGTISDYRSPSPVGYSYPDAVVHNWRYGITRACINLECPLAKKAAIEEDNSRVVAQSSFPFMVLGSGQKFTKVPFRAMPTFQLPLAPTEPENFGAKLRERSQVRLVERQRTKKRGLRPESYRFLL